MSHTFMTAGERVANTFELLEHILLDMAELDKDNLLESHLKGNRTILLSQRVCKAFRDIIKNSPPIQSKLYLTPPTANAEHRALNPLLGHGFKIAKGPKLDIRMKAYPCPVGEDRPLPITLKIQHEDCIMSPQSETPGVEESWRKMHLCEIPYAVYAMEAFGEYAPAINGAVKNPPLGVILDATLKTGRHSSSNGEESKSVETVLVVDITT